MGRELAHLYTHARWRKLRLHQLAEHPLCVLCQQSGRVTAATVCDHVTPHRGDWARFWAGPFQSLCKGCHDGLKQSMERSAQEPARFDPAGRVVW